MSLMDLFCLKDSNIEQLTLKLTGHIHIHLELTI